MHGIVDASESNPPLESAGRVGLMLNYPRSGVPKDILEVSGEMRIHVFGIFAEQHASHW
jgi:hypothetical protein